MLSMELSFQTRKEYLSRLKSEIWDVLVIGGGITGAAVARDAALRGLKVALIEKGDFASGTSSGSTKLLHGGVRYLENFEFKLVFEAIRERERLLKLYAPLVQNLEFVFPTWKGSAPARWKLNLGLFLYDAFSGFKRRHKNFSAQEALKLLPILKKENLTGACAYIDSFSPDYRLVTEVLKSAARASAVILNRVHAMSLKADATSGGSLEISDLLATNEGPSSTIRARSIFNCTGPFSDTLRRSLDLKPTLKLTQGVHFLLPKEKLPIHQAIVFPDPKLDRILFAIPWEDSVYLGTTDTSVPRAEEARATKADLEYVLSIISSYLQVKIDSKDIFQSWAAVRPLLAPRDNRSNSEVSRDHRIEESSKNIFHILGGKLTSHRLMGEEAINLLGGSDFGSGAFHKKSLTGKIPLQPQPARALPTQSEPDRLSRAYGVYAEDILELDSQLGLKQEKISPSAPHLLAEVYYAIRYEMAMTPLDFLHRRSSLYYLHPTREIAERVSAVFQKEFNWYDEIRDWHFEEVLRAYDWDGATKRKKEQ